MIVTCISHAYSLSYNYNYISCFTAPNIYCSYNILLTITHLTVTLRVLIHISYNKNDKDLLKTFIQIHLAFCIIGTRVVQVHQYMSLNVIKHENDSPENLLKICLTVFGDHCTQSYSQNYVI